MNCQWHRNESLIGIGRQMMLTRFVLLVALASPMLVACGVDKGTSSAKVGGNQDERTAIEAPSGSILFRVESSYSSDLYVVNADGSGLAQVTDSVGKKTGGAVSPDGTLIAYNDASREDEANGVYVASPDGSNAHLVAASDPNGLSSYFLFWTSKERLAFNRIRSDVKMSPVEFWTVNADGSDPVRISENNRCPGALDWSPEVESLAICQCGDHTCGVTIFDERGNVIRNLLNDDARKPNSPTWSPDGTRIAFLAREPDAKSESLFVVDADGANARSMYRLPDTLLWTSVKWSPDGSQLALAPEKEIVIVSLTDGSSRTIATGENMSSLAWSPDGKQVAYVSNDRGYKLYVVDSEGGDPKVVADPVLDRDITWSPISSQILFASDREHPPGFYWAALDSSDVGRLDWDRWPPPATPAIVEPVGGCPREEESHGCLSPDGNSAARVDPNTKVLIVRDVATNASDNIKLDQTNSWSGPPIWSPDGTRLAMYGVANGKSSLYVLDIATGKLTLIATDAGGFRSIAWAPDDSYVYYTKGTRCRYGCVPGFLYRVHSDGTGEEQFLDMRVDTIYGFVP